MIRKKIIFTLLFSFCFVIVNSQNEEREGVQLYLSDAIAIARTQSPDILVARHSFRSSYWSYCYYKARRLPSVEFTSTPNFDHRINKLSMPDGTSQFVFQNQLITNGTLSINQNIPFTGGTLSLKSSVNRLDILGYNQKQSYQTNPIVIAYQQSLLGYNQFKWEKKIEPLLYEKAKKSYVEALELVSVEAINKFFKLAGAQENQHIAQINYANADTLYSFAKGRYNIGTITENEMLQLEVNRLKEESNMLNAQIELDNCKQALRSFLGFNDVSNIEVMITDDIPNLTVDVDMMLLCAIQNSPDIVRIEQQRLESERNLAKARSSAGLKVDIFAQIGLTQTGEALLDAYKKPLNQQYVEVGIRLPLLDWGHEKGRVQVARSNRDMVLTQTEWARTNFILNVEKIVKQFNLQNKSVNVARRMDLTADRRNEVARKLYVLGKSTILDLNSAIAEKDKAKREYIHSLHRYWLLYYTLRALSLYDFEKELVLTEDYELLLR